MSIVGQAIQLSLQAASADWAGLFDRLEVWRSTSGASGPYVELTAPVWLGARLPSDILEEPPAVPPTGASVNIVGMRISFLVNETTEVDVTFTGTNPLSYAQAAAQITAGGSGLIKSFVSSHGRLVVETIDPGNKTILRVLPTDAAALLGLPTTDPAYSYGKDARIALTGSSTAYSFSDVHGDVEYFYKTRFSNSVNNNVSNFSVPFAAKTGGVVDKSLLIIGVVDLVDVQGRPVQNREVSIYTKFQGVVMDGRAMVSMDAKSLTDVNGHVSFPLVRGSQITVSISGTQLVRDITVPTDPLLTSFNLLDPAVGTDDVFVVQVPNIDFAVRRSL